MARKKKGSHKTVFESYTGQRYVTLHSQAMDHPAFLDMSANAQALIFRIGMEWSKTRHKTGDSNGEFQISTERIQHYLNLSERKAIRAMHEVIEHGFVEITEFEDWTRRQARRYRLCWLPTKDGKLPGKDWIRWKKGCPVFTVPTHRNKQVQIKQRPPKQQFTNLHSGGKQDCHSGGCNDFSNGESVSYKGEK